MFTGQFERWLEIVILIHKVWLYLHSDSRLIFIHEYTVSVREHCSLQMNINSIQLMLFWLTHHSLSSLHMYGFFYFFLWINSFLDTIFPIQTFQKVIDLYKANKKKKQTVTLLLFWGILIFSDFPSNVPDGADSCLCVCFNAFRSVCAEK